MKKAMFILGLIGTLFITSVCFAASVSVGTSGTPGNIELIRIYIDPYGHPIEETERLLAEQEVINRLTSEKIYFSEEERRKDQIEQIQQKYDVEEITKDGKNYWKCTPKNPKTVIVRKSRSIVKETSYSTEYITEYYNEEIPNPDYLQPEELEKNTIWFEVKQVEPQKKKQKNRDQDIDGMVSKGRWF